MNQVRRRRNAGAGGAEGAHNRVWRWLRRVEEEGWLKKGDEEYNADITRNITRRNPAFAAVPRERDDAASERRFNAGTVIS